MVESFLTKSDLKLILESLLYSASVDVCSNWYKEDVSNMIEIAKKIRNNSQIPLEDIYLFDDCELNGYRDDITETIFENFPEIKFYKK